MAPGPFSAATSQMGHFNPVAKGCFVLFGSNRRSWATRFAVRTTDFPNKRFHNFMIPVRHNPRPFHVSCSHISRKNPRTGCRARPKSDRSSQYHGPYIVFLPRTIPDLLRQSQRAVFESTEQHQRLSSSCTISSGVRRYTMTFLQPKSHGPPDKTYFIVTQCPKNR